MTVQIQSSSTTEVLALLARHRRASTYQGQLLSTLQHRLAPLEQNVPTELGLPGDRSAYLLLEGGWTVQAQWQQVKAAALEARGLTEQSGPLTRHGNF